MTEHKSTLHNTSHIVNNTMGHITKRYNTALDTKKYCIKRHNTKGQNTKGQNTKGHNIKGNNKKVQNTKGHYTIYHT